MLVRKVKVALLSIILAAKENQIYFEGTSDKKIEGFIGTLIGLKNKNEKNVLVQLEDGDKNIFNVDLDEISIDDFSYVDSVVDMLSIFAKCTAALTQKEFELLYQTNELTKNNKNNIWSLFEDEKEGTKFLLNGKYEFANKVFTTDKSYNKKASILVDLNNTEETELYLKLTSMDLEEKENISVEEFDSTYLPILEDKKGEPVELDELTDAYKFAEINLGLPAKEKNVAACFIWTNYDDEETDDIMTRNGYFVDGYSYTVTEKPWKSINDPYDIGSRWDEPEKLVTIKHDVR